MYRWRHIVFDITFAVNCLLLFLLFFENRISLPPWLQVAGRMHPLVLHFPIVLLVLYVFAILFIPKTAVSAEGYREISESVLLLTAFTAAFSALMGFFLSREEGYNVSSLLWHKWGGVLISVITTAWYAYRDLLQKTRLRSGITAVFAFIILVFTGHQGAGITHGQNFLLAPVMPGKIQQPVSLDEAFVYANMVRPVLESKCMTCHNHRKAKGELVMETEELLIKGGKSGDLWDTTKADLGLLLRRIHLPMEARKHMPPKGKPQLTETETAILYRWIRSGAGFKEKVTDLAETDTLRLIANEMFTTIQTEDYDFAAAGEKKVQQLNTPNRVVSPLAVESPALAVDFYNGQNFSPEMLNQLLEVKKQVVSLNLDHMPVKDEDMSTIGQFKNLRKLSLNFTLITGKGLKGLEKLSFLKELSLSGTAINKSDLLLLNSFPRLQKVFAWNTALTSREADEYKGLKGKIKFETGFKSDTMVLQLTPPILQNEEQIIVSPITLQLKHYIQGTEIRYTLDGTEPDSIHSPVYKANIILDKNVRVRAKAFKPGWISSEVMENYFYAAKYKPDSLVHLLPPDMQYKDEQGKLLIDLEKGDKNFKSGKWVAFRMNRMEARLSFNQPKTISGVTLSALIDIGSYIMPPVTVEVWGGNEPGKMKMLGRIKPVQPARILPAYLGGFECKFDAVTVKSIKVIAVPVARLPAWHPGKGDKGWIFADEIFVN